MKTSFHYEDDQTGARISVDISLPPAQPGAPMRALIPAEFVPQALEKVQEAANALSALAAAQRESVISERSFDHAMRGLFASFNDDQKKLVATFFGSFSATLDPAQQSVLLRLAEHVTKNPVQGPPASPVSTSKGGDA